jgi:sirohydrochlorin cobaltochelatase
MAGAATMKSTPPLQGVILFAHGSRDPLWHRPIEAVAERIRASDPSRAVACAYLELSQPDLPSAAATLIAQGVQHIRIVPLFLGMGKHAREDLPAITTAMRAQHRATEFELCPAVGENPLLLDTLCAIALQGAASTAPSP